MSRIIVAIISNQAEPPAFLLVKSRKDFGEFSGFYYPPGGHLEAGEDDLTCLKRELQEELGVNLLEAQKLAETESDIPGQITAWYQAAIDKLEIKFNTEELSDAGFFNETEMETLPIWPATKNIFEKFIFKKAESDQSNIASNQAGQLPHAPTFRAEAETIEATEPTILEEKNKESNTAATVTPKENELISPQQESAAGDALSVEVLTKEGEGSLEQKLNSTDKTNISAPVIPAEAEIHKTPNPVLQKNPNISSPNPTKSTICPPQNLNENDFQVQFKQKILSTLASARVKKREIRQNRLDLILNSFPQNEHITNIKVKNLLNISKRSASRYLNTLFKQGKIMRFGEKSATFYQKYS